MVAERLTVKEDDLPVVIIAVMSKDDEMMMILNSEERYCGIPAIVEDTNFDWEVVDNTTVVVVGLEVATVLLEDEDVVRAGTVVVELNVEEGNAAKALINALGVCTTPDEAELSRLALQKLNISTQLVALAHVTNS